MSDEPKPVPRFKRVLKFILYSGAYFEGALLAFMVVVVFTPTMRVHLGNSLQRAWNAFLTSQGSTALGWVSSTIVVPVLTVGAAVVLIRQHRGRAAMLSHWREDAAITLRVIMFVVLFYYGPLFLWKGFVRTVYDDHQSLAGRVIQLQREKSELSARYKTANDDLAQAKGQLGSEETKIKQLQKQLDNQEAPESPNSLRLRTIKLVNDLNAFWTRRPLTVAQPFQNPSTDEERQRNVKWDHYWTEAKVAYQNAGFRGRVLGIVREYENKGIANHILELQFEQPDRMAGGFESNLDNCIFYAGDLCVLQEMAYHVDANDQPIILGTR